MPGIDISAFWDLIERSGVGHATRQARLEWLENELTRLPLQEIVEYQVHYETTRGRGHSDDMLGAYWQVFGSSINGFHYGVSWLISLGREPYEKVVEQPDLLTTLPQVVAAYANLWCWTDEERPEFERLDYVAMRACRKMGVGEAFSAAVFEQRPSGYEWLGEKWDCEDGAEAERRLPLTMAFLRSDGT
ncbi:DUF4240 domain-containing protein [Nonomuraea sp. NPDC050790]|uniref:DUF4240 domain-containing protein n=1 Tax=Nonomuraea sp. NPDC050790 TaxID=3364371 RepID=UPI00378C50DF